jgi:hypothetical protein
MSLPTISTFEGRLHSKFHYLTLKASEYIRGLFHPLTAGNFSQPNFLHTAGFLEIGRGHGRLITQLKCVFSMQHTLLQMT